MKNIIFGLTRPDTPVTCDYRLTRPNTPVPSPSVTIDLHAQFRAIIVMFQIFLKLHFKFYKTILN